MKTFSISAMLVVSTVLGMLISFSETGTFISLTSHGKVSVKKVNKPLTTWSDTWPGSSGYHNYGWYTFDATGIPTGNLVSISWGVYDVPNRFTISDDCGLSQQNFTDWHGSASYPGPWGMSISNSGSGTLSIAKAAGCDTYKFLVETSTSSSLSDNWYVTH